MRGQVREIPVDRIRPEEGLGRKRDRAGHQELCRSIEQFGVLTPITVRPAPDDSGEYLLVKGQGRTLACRLLGLATVPAVVVDEDFADTDKVQQFLVENVARLRMSAVDRALLIAHARREGEETTDVAQRFGVSPSTVRRLDAQLDGATSGEVSALRAHNLNLSLHAVIARYVASGERAEVIGAVGSSRLSAKELDELFKALDWKALVALGPKQKGQRIRLLTWAAQTLATMPRNPPRERIRQLALALPEGFDAKGRPVQAAAG